MTSSEVWDEARGVDSVLLGDSLLVSALELGVTFLDTADDGLAGLVVGARY